MTIGSDDEGPMKPTKAKDEIVQLAMDFVFDPFTDSLTETWSSTLDLRDFIKTGIRPVRIARSPCL